MMTTQRIDGITHPGAPIDPGTRWSPGRLHGGLDDRFEVAVLGAGGQIAVRDAADPGGPALVFTQENWGELLRGSPDLVDLR